MKAIITKQALLDGEIFKFSNEEHQISIEDDDIRIATVSFEEDKNHEWRTGFKIEFNGALIHSSKTFAAMAKRLQKLIEKWNLKQTNNKTLCY